MIARGECARFAEFLNTSMKTVMGIDYSFTCPAVCVLSATPQWFVHYKKEGKPYKELPGVTWSLSAAEGEIPRFIELATWVMNIIKQMKPECIVLEDYAFGATGRLTQLSENAGTLKVKLYEQYGNIPLHVVAPTTMKKFATGKGIATKDDIWAAFVKREPHTEAWAKLCHPKALRIGSPVADIADAYFLAQYGRAHFT